MTEETKKEEVDMTAADEKIDEYIAAVSRQFVMLEEFNRMLAKGVCKT
jgi:hypothetical protein